MNKSYELLSGYLMPVLGLGTSRLAGSACGRVVRAALELNYRHLDTAELYGKSAAQVSLRWLLQKGAIVIPKASSIDHLRANMDMSGWELSAEDVREIEEIGIEAKIVDAVYT